VPRQCGRGRALQLLVSGGPRSSVSISGAATHAGPSDVAAASARALRGMSLRASHRRGPLARTGAAKAVAASPAWRRGARVGGPYHPAAPDGALGGQTYLAGALRFDLRASTAPGPPERSDDHLVFVEGVPAPGRNARIRRAASNSVANSSMWVLFSSQPGLFEPDMSLGRCGEPDATRRQRDLSSLRISSASTSRPAATSASDWRSASCSAARSASPSQSPGSSGRSSISVPSGRSVGSSTTSRPSRTRALIVIRKSVSLAAPPNNAAQQALAAGGREEHDRPRLKRDVGPTTVSRSPFPE